ncbi:uncharacterized protein J3R85_001236 [Psidium guajava]|nr:uncharacterized protein J3R85_001236 [Psidium guajava]
MLQIPVPECLRALSETRANQMRASNNTPVAKVQVVDWTPIRSYRENTLVTTSSDNDEVDGKSGPVTLYAKVSTNDAPYLRRVGLRNYLAYQELSSSLEEMFGGFTILGFVCSRTTCYFAGNVHSGLTLRLKSTLYLPIYNSRSIFKCVHQTSESSVSSDSLQSNEVCAEERVVEAVAIITSPFDGRRFLLIC